MREIVFRIGDIALRAALEETPTADLVWQALPIYARAETWGDEVYFSALVDAALENGARDVVEPGEIAFWPDGRAIAIGFGPTPLSRAGEIRLAGRVNVWARAVDDVAILKTVVPGERIAVLVCDS